MTGMRAWVVTTFSPSSLPSAPSFLPDGGISSFLLCLRDSETCRATVTSTGDDGPVGLSIAAEGFGATMISSGLGPRGLRLLSTCIGKPFKLLFGLFVFVFTRLLGTPGAACSLGAGVNDSLCIRGSVTARRGWGEGDRVLRSAL